jgi:hypothetical protein
MQGCQSIQGGREESLSSLSLKHWGAAGTFRSILSKKWAGTLSNLRQNLLP